METPTDTTAANADERTFDLALTNGATMILRQILASNGWAKKVKQSRRAARLVKRLPKLKPPKTDDDDATEAWANEPLALSVGESDRDLVKVCLRHFIEAGALSNTETTLVLLDEFGVTEE